MAAPRKTWAVVPLPGGRIAIFPVYNGQCGCRIWYVETLGL